MHQRQKVCIVTGGASGMGAATVRALVKEGGSVVLVDLDHSKALTIANDTGATMLIGDVSDSEFCDHAVDQAIQSYGRIDVLINCAGIMLRADASCTSDNDWQRILSVNVNGVFFMSRAAIRYMVPRQSGVIVNFGSIWGEVGSSGTVAYCATKGAVHQITRSMALDHVGDGLRINAVAPGEVNTPMLTAGRLKPLTAQELDRLADDTVPMKRLAEPEEIAEVVMFLISDSASYITGAIIPVDGGYIAR